VTDGHFPIAAAILVNPLLPGLQAAEVLHHQASAIDRIAENSSISADTANGRLLAAIGSQLPVSLVTAPAVMDGHEATEIERLAATYLGEYGEGQLALGRLAYFQELCSAGFSPTPDGAFADRSPVYTYLASLHAGCPDTPPTKPFSLVSRKIEMCVVVSTQDAVIPYRPTTALLAGHDYRVSALPHADLRGLDLCADFTI
jgi:hypothetical protein